MDTAKSYQDVNRAESAREVARLDLDVAREQVTVLLAQLNEGRVANATVDHNADAGSPASLERYVERVGRLKKHFQEVLALDREAYLIDDRVQSWLTSFAALVGGVVFFSAQLLVMVRYPGRVRTWARSLGL